jgi:hypothetical protein
MRVSQKMLTILVPFCSILAQPNPPSPAQAAANGGSRQVVRTDTNLVLVQFGMTPKKGQASDLRPEDIELREDGSPRKIAVLQGGQLNPPVPVEVNLLFADLRPSSMPAVGPAWLRSQPIDLGTIDDRGRVSVAIWAIGQEPIQLTPPTRDKAKLDKAMDGLVQVWSTTTGAHRTSVFRAIATLASQGARVRTNTVRMLVAVAHNIDPFYDKEGIQESVRAAQDGGIAIFPVLVRAAGDTFRGLNASADTADSRPDQKGRPSYGAPPPRDSIDNSSYPELIDPFLSLAKKTNGQSLRVDFLTSDVPFGQIFQWLGDQIKSEYLVGFYADSSDKSRPHKVQVTLKDSSRGRITGDTQTITH